MSYVWTLLELNNFLKDKSEIDAQAFFILIFNSSK